jgi:hypothetical protein
MEEVRIVCDETEFRTVFLQLTSQMSCRLSQLDRYVCPSLYWEAEYNSQVSNLGSSAN